MARQRLKGVLLVALLLLLIVAADAWAESRWTGPTTYNVDGCQPETVQVIDEVAKEISFYTVPVTHAAEAKIEITCSPTNHLSSTNGRGSVTRWIVGNRIRNAEMWVNSTREHLDIYRTIRHEFGHAMGLPHVDSLYSLMRASPLINYYDTETLRLLIDRYKHSYAVTDKYGNRYSPCVLFLGQWWWTIEHLTGDGWRVAEYGEAHCS